MLISMPRRIRVTVSTRGKRSRGLAVRLNGTHGTYADWPELPPVLAIGAGSAQTVWYELHRATIDNQLVEDISELLIGGEIDLNHDREIRTVATFQLREPDRVAPYTDYLAVFLNRAFDDGAPATRDQLGLYTVRVPPGIRTIERADATYTGQDLTAVLARYAFSDSYNIAASVNVVTAVTDILELAGLTRYLILPTAELTPAVVSFPVGTTYLTVCNALLDSIGYYHLSMMPDGRLFSTPGRALQYVEPYRTITDDDLMRPVEIQPLDATVANIVIVVNDNPSAAPLTATRRNDAADSPTSTVTLGPLPRVESRGDLATQAAVDALADRLLSEGRSFYQTAKLSLLPDPLVVTPHLTVDLQLTGKLEILNGRWWMRTANVKLSTDPVALELNRVTDTIQGTLI